MFRDIAAIQIAAAIVRSGRDLSHRETAKVAFELAAALEEERARWSRFDRGAGAGLPIEGAERRGLAHGKAREQERQADLPAGPSA